MRKLSLLLRCMLLVTTPMLLACPQGFQPRVVSVSNCQSQTSLPCEESSSLSYDQIIDFLDELESGELEKKASLEELEQINEFLALLAKEGILPDDFEGEAELEEDIEELFEDSGNLFEYAPSCGADDPYVLTPAIFSDYDQYDVILCRGWLKKKWKKTKHFVKKHKKEIIIGAAIVVAVSIVVVAVVVTSSASAAAAAAGGAKAAADAKKSRSNKDRSSQVASIPKSSSSSIAITKETPTLKAAMDEHVSLFKESMVEDQVAQQSTPSQGWSDLSFGEKVRELGADLAHQAYDGLTELASFVPQLFEEIKDVGARFLPESFCPSNSGSTGTPVENYENLVAQGHKAIDSAFSTDQAEFFTAEAKANDIMNTFTVGMVPIPGSFNKIFTNTTRFKETGKVLDRAGLTKSGRALMKHGNRKGSPFPKAKGNPAQVNRQGQMILEEILNDTNNEVFKLSDGSLKVYSSNGRGAFFQKDGSFRGFIEWRHEEKFLNRNM